MSFAKDFKLGLLTWMSLYEELQKSYGEIERIKNQKMCMINAMKQLSFHVQELEEIFSGDEE